MEHVGNAYYSYERVKCVCVCVCCEICGHLVKMIYSFGRNQSLALIYNYGFLLRNGHFVSCGNFWG